uniref:DUF3090 family protein n=1 Tax=Candidatus Limnocylindrus sp. TaxID=2802978 RepID=UPI00404A1B0A
MARLILVRHARTAETGIKLSGRIKGIPLSPAGRKEAAALAEALSAVQIAGIASSPMQRCLETAEAVRSMRGPSVKSRPDIVVDERLTEVEYGDWSGQELRKLMKDPLWSTVQRQPSAMVFPNGESLRAASARAVEAIREIDARFSDDETWLCASHGDIIKAIVADALGTPTRPLPAHCHRSGQHHRHSLQRRAPNGRAREPLSRGCGRWSGRQAEANIAPRATARRTLMARRIIRFDPPDQFIAGAIGEPGQRIFHLQAIGGGIAATVVVEKSQIAVLARRIVEMLKDLSEGGSVQLPNAPLPLPRKLPALAEPFTAEFRVGTIALAWDPLLTRLILEFRDDMSVEDAAAPPPINDAPDGPDVLRVSLSIAAALEFAENSLQLAAAGRPIGPNCGVPLDPRGHRCARKAALLN